VDQAAREEPDRSRKRAECETTWEVGSLSDQTPQHPQVNSEYQQPNDQCRHTAFERDLQEVRMHVSDRLAAVIKHSPLTPVPFYRIHPHADEQMSRFADQQVETVAPNHLAPACRLIGSVEEANVPTLLQQQNAGEYERHRASCDDENGSA